MSIKFILHFILLYVFFYFNNNSVVAQSKMELGVSISPIFSIIDKNYESEGISLTGGIEYIYHMNNRLCFSIGVQNIKPKYTINYNFYPVQSGDPSIPVKSIFSNQYLYSPLSINFNLTKINKHYFSASIGAFFSFQIKNSETTTFANNSTHNTEYGNKYLGGYYFGIGYNFFATKKIKLRLQPNLVKFRNTFDIFMVHKPTIYQINFSFLYAIFSNENE